jgi:hypothetical protein
MIDVILAYVGWGAQHWILFGWTAFWAILVVLTGCFTLARVVFFVLPNRILRTVKILARGWPPPHLDADGDWRPEPKPDKEPK